MRLFLAMPGTACPAARRPRSTEPAAPATAGTRTGLGGSAPIHALGHGRTPAVIRLCLRKSERVPSAAKPQTSGNEGPRWPPTAGITHRGQASVPVWGEYPSRHSPCGRLGWPVAPGTGRIPPKGPKRTQHYRRQSVAYMGRNYSPVMAGVRRDTTRDCLASTLRTSEPGQRFTCQPFYLLFTAGPPAGARAPAAGPKAPWDPPPP